MANAKICAVDDCGNMSIARNLCGKHYQKWRKTATGSEVRCRAKPGEPEAWIKEACTYSGNECLLWPYGKYPSGYGMFNLPSGSAVMASRYMCQLVNGAAPSGKHQAAHSCGHGSHGCMTPAHLYWATREENEADKIRHGTSNRGSRNGRSLIDEGVARQIRRAAGRRQDIANKFSVSLSTVYDIKSGRSWGWLA